MKPTVLTIAPENAEQKVADGWQTARQRDFTGGETLARLPEMVARNQLIRMENAIVSPEGLITECWQMDKALFINVSGGIVVAPVPGSALFTVYAAADNDVISFTFDPSSPVAYDMADASGYPGYALMPHANPVTILGISHGTPFLGKNYCCASTDLYSAGVLTGDPESIDFGSVQTLTTNQSSLTITNASAEVMRLTGITMGGADSSVFGHTAAFPQVLEPAGTYTFDVTYKPSVPGDNAATLNLSNTLGVMQIQLTGTAESMITLTPAVHDFGTRQKGSVKEHIFQLANDGTRTVTLDHINAGGNNPSFFTSELPLPTTVDPGATLDIAVRFAPLTVTAYSAVFDLVTDVGTISGVNLSGAGGVFLTPTPASIVLFGQSFVPTSGTFSFHNTSAEDSVTVNSLRFLNGGGFLAASFGAALPLVIAPGATATLTVTFTAPNFAYLFSDAIRVTTTWGVFDLPVSGRRV